METKPKPNQTPKENKRNTGVIVRDLKLYYKAIITKLSWRCRRAVMETNKTESAETGRVLTETTRTYIGGSIASLGNRTGKLGVFMEEKKTRPTPILKKKKSLKLRPKCKILNCKTDRRR